MRALLQQRQLSTKTPALDEHTYRVDKVVRDRLRTGNRFGFDHSEVLRLELEGMEEFEGSNGKKLAERLSAATTRSQSRPLTYDDWKERKEAENRLKSKLLRSLHSSDQDLQLQLSQTRQKELESTQKLSTWQANKRKEAKDKRSESRKKAEREEAVRRERQEKGTAAYQAWLQESLRKLQTQKQQEAQQRALRKQHAKIEAAQADAHQKTIEARYQEWLQSKLTRKQPASKPDTPRYKLRLPVMLAYSPNRPKQTSSPSFVSSSQGSLQAALVPEESEETPESSLHELPNALERNNQRIFDELSSIQRTSHFLGNPAESDEGEFPSQAESISSSLD